MSAVHTSRRPPPPLDLLSRALPSADRTLLLRACLADPAEAIAAWTRWRELCEPARWFAGNPRYKRLGALLAHTLLATGSPIERADATWLKAALLHERTRSDRYRQVLQQVLAALAARSVPVLLVKGTAAAETVWDDPSLRHSHDIDLLVAPARQAAAASALARAGLREVRDAPPHCDPSSTLLMHPSGVSVWLHARALKVPSTGLALEGAEARSCARDVAGIPVRVPSADDLLLHVCAHAMTDASRSSGIWVCDAHFLVRRHTGLDWERLRTSASEAGLAGALAAALRYLSGAIGTPVPARVAAALAVDARRAGRLERDLLVHGARSEGASLRAVWRAAGARSRVTLLRWVLAPHPRYLRWVRPAPGCPAPVLQLERLAGTLSRRLLIRRAPPASES